MGHPIDQVYPWTPNRFFAEAHYCQWVKKYWLVSRLVGWKLINLSNSSLNFWKRVPNHLLASLPSATADWSGSNWASWFYLAFATPMRGFSPDTTCWLVTICLHLDLPIKANSGKSESGHNLTIGKLPTNFDFNSIVLFLVFGGVVSADNRANLQKIVPIGCFINFKAHPVMTICNHGVRRIELQIIVRYLIHLVLLYRDFIIYIR